MARQSITEGLLDNIRIGKSVSTTDNGEEGFLVGTITFIGTPWSSKIKLTDELKEQICDQVSELLGGHHSTRVKVYNNLMSNTPQHWGLDRILVEQYGKSPAKLKYCAGQHYSEELNTIRTFLK